MTVVARSQRVASWDVGLPGFEILEFESPIVRCVDERLTMCERLVIIKRFREFSLACLCNGSPVGCATRADDRRRENLG